jgi:CheY-like chemotaxis protein
MNIARRLIDMMGGNIQVDSIAGIGTTVSVRLPQKSVSPERIGSELAENLRLFKLNSNRNMNENSFTREYMPYGRVLVVDDVDSNLYVAKGLMTPYGLTVETTICGEGAIEKIKSGEVYDIIFMDHMMPLMDGIEAAKAIREHGYSRPIVALTANAVAGQAEIFLNNGFDDFISKPVDIRQLNATLNKFIRDKQLPETIEKAREEKERVMDAHAPVVTIAELNTAFVNDAKRVLPALESIPQKTASVSDEVIRLFTLSAHSIKSALANIGETGLAHMAQTLESAGKANDIDAIAAQSQSFTNALRKVIAKAEAEIKTESAADSDEAPRYLREQLAIVANACKEYDVALASDALNHLKKMVWTKETEKILETISLQLLHSDFLEAAKTAENHGERAADYC